ncbi:5424_t:CDS:2, partial [Racocetra fulgida]
EVGNIAQELLNNKKGKYNKDIKFRWMEVFDQVLVSYCVRPDKSGVTFTLANTELVATATPQKLDKQVYKYANKLCPSEQKHSEGHVFGIVGHCKNASYYV